MTKKSATHQMIAGSAATLSMFIAGFHFAWVTQSMPRLLADDSDVTLTSNEISWIVSFLMVGQGLGPFIGGALANRLGRKLPLFLAAVAYFVGGILLGLAQSFWMYIIARFVAGLGIGISFTILPMYLGEIAEDSNRGAVCSLIPHMMNIGALVTTSIGPWVSLVALACFGVILPVVFASTFVWMPDTPYFLIMKRRSGEAEKSLSWLRGTTDVKEALKNIQQHIETGETDSGRVKDLFTTSGNRKVFVIMVALILAQQCNGMIAILAYSTVIFEASETNMNANISVIIVGFAQVMSGFLTIFTVDMTGRRPLLFLSICGSIVFFVGEALYFQLLAAGTDVSSIAWLPITCMIGIVISHTIGLGCVPPAVLSEIIPFNIKAPALTINNVVSCISLVAIIKLYQNLNDTYGFHVGFWGFAVINLCSGIFVYFVLPETKQKSFMEIQEALYGAKMSSKS